MTVPKLPPSDYRQLVLARQLMDQAETFVDQRTPATLGLGVSVAQDAAELVLRALTRGWQLNVPQPQSIMFNQLLDAVEAALDSFGLGALPFRPQLIELNRARVDFKHFGHVPTEQTARQHFGNAAAFPESVCTNVLRITPEELSITNLIEDELHANEIVLLAYYIATINIESAYYAAAGEHIPFEGIVLTDTFQLNEPSQGDVEGGFSFENSSRAKKQRQQPIRVVFSNPPYSAQQESEGDNNKNEDYPLLDERIAATYVARSKRKLFKNMYDSYVRAIRWASDRIADRGVVAFVTNGSFLKAPNLDGVRLGLVADFSHLYVFDLRGDQRTSGETSRREGGKIFGSGSRASVAITIMVKDPNHQGAAELYYHDIGDYLTTEQKLELIDRFGSVESVPWTRLQPNDDGEWAEQSDPKFGTFLSLGNKDDTGGQAVFGVYSLGVITNRDPWVSNYSKAAVEHSVRKLIEQYQADSRKYAAAVKGLSKKEWPDVEGYITTDSKRISWTRSLKASLKRQKKLEFVEEAIACPRVSPRRPSEACLGSLAGRHCVQLARPCSSNSCPRSRGRRASFRKPPLWVAVG